MGEVSGQAVELKVAGNAFYRPRLRATLKRSEQQLSGIKFIVGLLVRNTQGGPHFREAFERFGDKVKVLSSLKRRKHAVASEKVSRPHAACDHDLLCGDGFARGKLRTFHGTVSEDQLGDLTVLDDECAFLPCPLRKRKGGIDWIGLTIARQVNAAARVRECNTWPLIGYEIRFNPFTDYIEGIGHGRLPAQFRLAFPIERKGDGSRLLVAGCLSGNRLQ